MEIGVWLPSARRLAGRDTIRRTVVEAEALGYDAVWVSDHVVAPLEDVAQFGVIYDPLVVLSLAAGLTSRVKLGTSVILVPYRQAVLQAKMLASIDDLSDGRLIYGVGAGWNAKESAALGLPFHERGAMTDEYLRAMQELWVNSRPSFSGKYVQFQDVVFGPRPVQQPHPPIWVGGHSPAALRRTVAFGAAWHPSNRTNEELRQGYERLQTLCQRAGRQDVPAMTLRLRARVLLDDRPDPAPEHRAGRGEGRLLRGTPEELAVELRGLQQVGVQHLLLEFLAHDVDEHFRALEVFARQVRPAVA